jgi:MFS family permease
VNASVSILAAHVFSMLGFSSYAVSLLELKALWAMTNTEAGLVASGFFMGYMACVSMWNAMTDRHDARVIYFLGCVLSAMGSLGFGVLANGFFSGLFFQLLLCAVVSATYMPGLRILSERLTGATQSRYVSFYTAFFGIGVAGSLILSGWATDALGWRYSFAFAAVGPVVALVLVWLATRHDAPHKPQTEAEQAKARPMGHHAFFDMVFPIQSWRIALREKAVVGFMIGYAVHCMELFGTRAWTVAFLAFSISLQSEVPPLQAASLAAIVNLVSTPASILGNEMALKLGRRAWIVLVMTSGSVVGILMSLLAGSPWWLVLILVGLQSMLIMADSATLTAGLVASAPKEVKGAAMGLYSLLGFGAGAVGPAVFGAALDIAGGGASIYAWAAAFLAIGLGCLAFPFIDRRLFGSSPFQKNS